MAFHETRAPESGRDGPPRPAAPVSAAVVGRLPGLPVLLLGMGLGGLFDGVVLHQLLQWHHMLSAWYPIDSVANLRINTLWDGIFHSLAYVMIVAGIFLLWRAAQRGRLSSTGIQLLGGLLCGWGSFNVVEGFVSHILLGIHHVNETVARESWHWWDIAFLVCGALMIAAGLWLMRPSPQVNP